MRRSWFCRRDSLALFIVPPWYPCFADEIRLLASCLLSSAVCWSANAINNAIPVPYCGTEGTEQGRGSRSSSRGFVSRVFAFCFLCSWMGQDEGEGGVHRTRSYRIDACGVQAAVTQQGTPATNMDTPEPLFLRQAAGREIGLGSSTAYRRCLYDTCPVFCILSFFISFIFLECGNRAGKRGRSRCGRR